MDTTPSVTPTQDADVLPDHTQLPDEDGNFANNYQEHPQSQMLSGSLLPRLRELHPDGQFSIGCDSGIYWKYTQPPLDGCKAPDWFYVPGVPPLLDGRLRRSYVLWQEVIAPAVIVEYVSGDGSEERDTTPHRGKFWVYEQAIRADYYVIFEPQKAKLEVYRLVNRRYELVEANAAGRFPIELLRVEFGLWEGVYLDLPALWLRAWDAVTGKLLPTPEHRADAAEELLDETRSLLQEECERAEDERKRAEAAETARDAARLKLQQLAEKLRSLGIDPDAA